MADNLPLKRTLSDSNPPPRKLRCPRGEGEEVEAKSIEIDDDNDQKPRARSEPVSSRERDEDDDGFVGSRRPDLPKDAAPVLRSEPVSSRERDEDDDGFVGSRRLDLPKDAAPVLRLLAAELIFEKSLVGFQEKNLAALDREIFRLVEEFPGICHRMYEVLYHQPNGSSPKVERNYPLSLVCYLRPSLELVKTIYEANPDAVRQEEVTEGGVPLHQACSWEASLDVIRFLHSKHKAGIQLAERRYGMLPLHLALAFKGSDEVINYLLDSWPESARRSDNDGFSPLHHAVLEGSISLTIANRLFQMNPGSLVQTDEANNTPLHIACAESSIDTALLRFLYNHAPQARDIENSDGMTPLFIAARRQTVANLDVLLPTGMDPPRDTVMGATILHAACEGDNTMEVLEYIIGRWPNFVNTPSVNGEFYPIHMAVYRPEGSLDAVKLIMKYHPDCLSSRDGIGRTPLRTAELSTCSKELVAFLEEHTPRNVLEAEAGANAENGDINNDGDAI